MPHSGTDRYLIRLRAVTGPRSRHSMIVFVYGRRRQLGARASRTGPAMRGLAPAVAVVMVAALTTSCWAGDHVWGSQDIGVSRVGRQPTLTLFSCAQQRPVTAVRVTIHNIHAPVDKVVWQIVRTGRPSAAAPQLKTLTIGTTPTGYRTVVPLNGALPRGLLDVGLDRGNHPEGVVTFSLDQLGPGSLVVSPDWYDGDQFVDQQTFEKVNRRSC
jgi:hypothetical protein